VEYGWNDVEYTENDEDLRSLHEETRFLTILKDLAKEA
jgi:hypothetical protein